MKWIFCCLLTLNLALLFHLLFEQSEFKRLGSDSPEESGILLLKESRSIGDGEFAGKAAAWDPILEVERDEFLDCQRLGPFNDIESAREIADSLSDRGYQVKLRLLDRATKQLEYRVLIPPAISVQQAYRRLREIRSQSNFEGYLISQGSDFLAISLGVFQSKQAAVDHGRKLIKEGYDVQVRPIPRTIRDYWIFIDRGVSMPIEEISRVSNIYLDVELTETVCLN